MSAPNQSISERFSWLTRDRALAGAFGIALILVFIWPRSGLAADLVIITAVPGSLGAILWGLTFWSKARVQIGRQKLRYKTVRRIAGAVALLGLPFLLVQRTSIYLRSPREAVSESSEAYPDPKQWRMRLVVAIAHLEGDDGNRLEQRLRDAVGDLDSRLRVTPVILNRIIAVSGHPQGIAHLEALGSVTDVRVDSLIWGNAKGITPAGVGPLYETRFGANAQFGGAYMPADFKLPELPVDDLCAVLRLTIASRSAEEMIPWGFKFGDALEPLIKQVRAIADDPGRLSGWSADTRARVNLVVGIASNLSALELNNEGSSRVAVDYCRRALADWTRERDPLEWAMAQRNLGSALIELSEINLQVAPLQAAASAYQDALALYQARSDRIDAARMQFELGRTLVEMAAHEGGGAKYRQAVDHYRAALNGFDARFYTMSWAETQRNLGRALNMLADQEGSAKDYEDAIAADRQALTVYHKQSEPLLWAATEGEMAESLELLGQMRSNVDDLKLSVAISRRVLDGYPRERDPRGWAANQANLGNGLMGLNDVQPDPSYPQQAAVAFRAALQELTFEREPVAWATAKSGLGGALVGLGESGNDTYYFEQAIDAYNDALKVFKPDRDPVSWAWTKSDLGDALQGLGERRSGIRHLRDAVDNYREALTVITKDKMPVYWEKTQHNLQLALDELHKRGWEGSR